MRTCARSSRRLCLLKSRRVRNVRIRCMIRLRVIKNLASRKTLPSPFLGTRIRSPSRVWGIRKTPSRKGSLLLLLTTCMVRWMVLRLGSRPFVQERTLVLRLMSSPFRVGSRTFGLLRRMRTKTRMFGVKIPLARVRRPFGRGRVGPRVPLLLVWLLAPFQSIKGRWMIFGM